MGKKLTLQYIHEHICPDFKKAIVAGNTTCQHKVGIFCDLPFRFMCDLYAWNQYKRKEGIKMSPSRMSTFLSCPYKYWINYEAKIPYEKRPGYFWLGGMAHVAIQRIVRGLEWHIPAIPPDVDATEDQRLILQGVCEYLQECPGKIPSGDSPEKRVQTNIATEHEPVWLGGFIDDVVTRKRNGLQEKIIIDYKYAQVDYNLLTMFYQFGTYLIGVPEADFAGLVLIKKPALKRKKNESDDDFLIRIHDKLTEKGFAKQVEYSEFSRSQIPIESIKREAIHVVAMIDFCKQQNLWPRATSPVGCPGCPRLTYCRRHI
jgi:hypothetical protein